MDDALILAFEDQRALAHSLADALRLPLEVVAQHRFPDGELKLTLPASVPARVIVLRGLHEPNDKLVQLLLTASTARELGATHLTLVAPYLAYMRQDIAFHPGEAISQRVVARFLGQLFDTVLTIDPHLHRIASLDEVMPGSTGVALSAAPLLGDWVARHWSESATPLLVGPDEEAGQWVRSASAATGLPGAVCVKTRRGDRLVEIDLPDVPVQGRALVLLDDVASTGRTLGEAARALLARGATTVDVAVVHALFVGDAVEHLRSVGVRHVWSTDAVPHASNVVSVVPLLARAIATAPGVAPDCS